ncbi:9121_t:CDS:1, partial [Cetraspora pellucida]
TKAVIDKWSIQSIDGVLQHKNIKNRSQLKSKTSLKDVTERVDGYDSYVR